MPVIAGVALAVIGFLLVLALLWLQVLIIRYGLDPVREQLQRIADEIEVRNDFDAGEGDEVGG